MMRPVKAAIIGLGLTCVAVPAMAEDRPAGSPGLSVIRPGSTVRIVGAPENFKGIAHVEGLFQQEEPARIGGATVTFEPGAHTAWHTHPLGQTLVILSGHGLVQQWGSPAERFGPGEVVSIPPGVKHWHGAGLDERMAHVALAERLDGRSVNWMEPVSDADYARAAGAQPR
ncbi:cupin domain-containing protein [Sphingobium scionense]|uniref:4-carboxymuconolactone decarboxylase n=1 Tax=Sphingobium scionense TaxID=1404341 RepID=A0A7W6PY84_9SPHN|nr:cupin domain-containing protein [Sphingobium scionense]MBB4150042.1 4-carboxymuconolactone decarboxylase [Sphingobium scionense]